MSQSNWSGDSSSMQSSSLSGIDCRQFVENLPGAVYLCDSRGRIQHYNDAAVELWGRKPAVGHDEWCGSWRIYYPDGRPIALESCAMAIALREGRCIRGEEIIIERPDGSRRNVLSFPSPVRNNVGQIVGAINMLMDITADKAAQTALVEAKESAEAANRSKDRFLAVLSHELRTPLTPVLMTVAAMAADPDVSPSMRENIAMIQRNVELETKLIDDLLDLSRITSGKLRLQPQAIDMNDAVRHVCDICSQQIFEKGIRLHCDLDHGIGSVNADPARLQQVLWNVIKNAAKFTPQGGEISVRTRRVSPQRAQIAVRDNGAGIESHVLPRIFDAFEQGDMRVTRQFGGLGLGLAISKALVDLHGGTITAQSDGPDRGSMFTIELPARVAATAPRQLRTDPTFGPRPLRARLLVVEDHHDTAILLGRLLGAAGYAVKTTHSAAGALDLATQEPFDLLISDIGLPDATGYELMQQLCARGKVKGIAMSGYGMDEDIRKSHDAGFAEHLVKPINVAQLQDAIQRILQVHVS